MAKEVLQRKAFTISRLAEFVSESELVKQIGHLAWQTRLFQMHFSVALSGKAAFAIREV